MDVLNSCVTFQGPTIKTLCSIELNVVDLSLASYCSTTLVQGTSYTKENNTQYTNIHISTILKIANSQ